LIDDGSDLKLRSFGRTSHFFSPSRYEEQSRALDSRPTMPHPRATRFDSLIGKTEVLSEAAIKFSTEEDAGADSSSSPSPKVYRTLQVQIVHRHGDRTPVTPLKDQAYWAKTLIPKATLEKISSNTNVIHPETPSTHFGKGSGPSPFGKLTELGLVQMVQVGGRLREELSTDENNHVIVDEKGNQHYPHVWHPGRPLDPSNIRVFSTDFHRTIQSVQGLLVGLFPEGCEDPVTIDLRNASWMMPDPIRLRWKSQEKSEGVEMTPQQILTNDEEMHQRGRNAAKALEEFLGEGIEKMPIYSFYVDEGNAVKENPKSWIQLSEVTTCLSVRNLLPQGISLDDRHAISEHAAKWSFELLSYPELAMDTMVRRQIDYMMSHASEPPVTIWSGHDFTLIGLMVAYRLEQPTSWPEYGSFLKLELLEVSDLESDETDYVVRFSLNGERLRSRWGDGQLLDMIPLHSLNKGSRDEGALYSS
jgi:hypothetical protein